MTYLVSVPEAHYASVIGHLHSLMAGAQTEASAEAQDEGRNWSEDHLGDGVAEPDRGAAGVDEAASVER